MISELAINAVPAPNPGYRMGPGNVSTRAGWLVSAFGVLLALSGGAQSAPAGPAPTDSALPPSTSEVDAAQDVEEPSAQTLQLQRTVRIYTLEQQIQAGLEGEALRLGSIGSALLDLAPDNLAAHMALAKYYDRVDETSDAEFHRDQVEALVTALQSSGAGTEDAPWVTTSSYLARMAADELGFERLGDIFISTDRARFVMAMIVRPPGAKLTDHEQRYFDLSATLIPLVEPSADASASRPSQADPGPLVSELAGLGDPAAHATIGRTLLTHGKNGFERALQHLTVATEGGNLMADLLLAEGHLLAATLRGPVDGQFHLEQAAHHYLAAIASGSTDAMFQLANLYLEGRFGGENLLSGITLLQQAVDANHEDSMRRLAALWLGGEGGEKDVAKGIALLYQAGELGNRAAQLTLGRVASSEEEFEIDRRAVRWLRELADDDDAEAMVILANLYAGGHYGRVRVSRARRLYQSAGNLSERPDTINEIAWTLAVSDQDALRDPDQAIDLMERLMSSFPAARAVPAYLDTWAAAHAASGNYERAVEIQRDAIASAQERNETRVLGELQSHLRLFEAGEPVEEAVP